VVAGQVIDGLISECRRHYPLTVTPIFQSHQAGESKLPVLAIGLAAVVESYYRSGCALCHAAPFHAVLC